MKSIACEKYNNKTNISDHNKRKHKIKGERGSETHHDSLSQIEKDIVDRNKKINNNTNNNIN